MAILDWFKEIPLSAVLKEKLTDLEKENGSLKIKVSSLEAENSILKTNLDDSEKQRRALEEQIIKEHNNPLTFDEKTSTWVSPVGRNKPVRAVAKTGVSGKHHPNSPETPPRATRLDGLIPAYPPSRP